MASKQKDLTKGNIFRLLISFTIPLILGNVFQLAYNMVDSIVIGRFAGDTALAAVGTSDPVMNLLILGVSGLCIGASVLMSNHFGAGNYEELRRQAGTAIVLVMSLSAVILLFGLFLTEQIFRAMKTPDAVLPMAAVYMRIIFLGMPFTCLYNVYAAALRSVGDSRTPIRFLIISCILNGILDVILIAGFHLETAGAGLATVTAEAVSALLCVFYTRRNVEILHLSKEDFRPDKELMIRTIRLGGITSLQQCSQPIGKLLIQGVINSMGVSAMAAFTAVGKLEDFGLVPGRSISNAMMTFTAQNDGAGQEKRMESGFHRGILLELLYGAFICVVLLLFDRQLLGLFSSGEDMIREGMRYFALMSWFYWLPGFTNAHQGYFRGVKAMSVTLYGTLTQISFRVLFTFLLVPRIGIVGVGAACIAGWSAMLLWQAPYRIYLKKHRSRSQSSRRE